MNLKKIIFFRDLIIKSSIGKGLLLFVVVCFVFLLFPQELCKKGSFLRESELASRDSQANRKKNRSEYQFCTQ